MRTTTALSVTLPIEMAEMIKRRVAQGDYATDSEVVRDGLRALKEREDAIENWLRTKVVPAAMAHKENPSNVTNAKGLREQLQRLVEDGRNPKTARDVLGAAKTSLRKTNTGKVTGSKNLRDELAALSNRQPKTLRDLKMG